MLFFQPQEGLWRAHEVIEVCQGLEGMKVLAQHRRQHLLGGGFARGAGDLHHGDVKLAPIPGRKSPQRRLSVIHGDVEFSGQQYLGHLGAQAARRALLKGHVYVGVAVEPLAHQGHEQVPGQDIPAIGADAPGGIAVLQELSAYGSGNLPGRTGDPHSRSAFLTRRDSSAIFSHRVS